MKAEKEKEEREVIVGEEGREVRAEEIVEVAVAVQ